MVYCNYCGEKNPEKSIFCCKCGKSIPNKTNPNLTQMNRSTIEIDIKEEHEIKKYTFIIDEIAFLKCNQSPGYPFLVTMGYFIIFLGIMVIIGGLLTKEDAGPGFMILFLGMIVSAMGAPSEGDVEIGTAGGSINKVIGDYNLIQSIQSKILYDNPSILHIKMKDRYDHLINKNHITKVIQEERGIDWLVIIALLSLIGGIIGLFYDPGFALLLFLVFIICPILYRKTLRLGVLIETIGGHNRFFNMDKKESVCLISEIKCQ